MIMDVRATEADPLHFKDEKSGRRRFIGFAGFKKRGFRKKVSASDIASHPTGCPVDKEVMYGVSGTRYGAGQNEVRVVRNDVRL